ncbi:MAG: hypothetical protein KBF82_03270 [Chitinophagaceae bacterium]|nr:hypothetical protein [Chitinophagaceae bacterium]
MGAPFNDISLYLPTPHIVGTPGYYEQVSLENFVSDLYVQKMNGYKPPKTSRITIQPAFHDTWNRTWKTGSIVATAPYFNYDEYAALNTKEKYKHILDLIQSATIPLSEEYGWDKEVFENAYKKVLDSDFQFKIDYPIKKSRDRKKAAKLIIEKTETVTSVFVDIECNGSSNTHKLFDKKNAWWYDCTYILARHNKWFDKDRFGIGYNKGKIELWYSLENDKVELFENGNRVTVIDFGKYFMFN